MLTEVIPYIPYILSAIGGGLAVSGGWYFVARRYDAKIDTLRYEKWLAECRSAGAEGRLITANALVADLTEKQHTLIDRNEALATNCARAFKERNEALRQVTAEKAKSWSSQPRTQGRFGKKVAG